MNTAMVAWIAWAIVLCTIFGAAGYLAAYGITGWGWFISAGCLLIMNGMRTSRGEDELS